MTKRLKFNIIYKMKTWQQKEVEILRKYYNQIPMEELLEKLPGRTENSIYKKVQYLRKKGWAISRR